MGSRVYRPRKEINHGCHLLSPHYGPDTMLMRTYFPTYFPEWVRGWLSRKGPTHRMWASQVLDSDKNEQYFHLTVPP